MNEAIASILKSQGWQDIVNIIEGEMKTNLASIPTNQDDRAIATQYVGRIEAQVIINKAFKEIEKEATEQTGKKVIYK